MKKYLFLAVTTLAFAACSNEGNEVTNDNWNGEIRLSSDNTASPAKRSLSQDLQSTKFDAGETIGVFINENVVSGVPSISYTQPLVCTVAQDQSALSFNAGIQYFPQNKNGVNIYGIYPASAVSGKQVDSTIDFSIRSDQSTDADYKASDLMIGKPSNNNPVTPTKEAVNLGFTHILSKIDINLVSGIGTPALTGATVKIKNVLTQTSFIPNSFSTVNAKGEKVDVIAAKTIDGNNKCSAIIIPQTVESANGNAFIEITLANKTVLNYKLGEDTVFKGEKKYTYNITVNLKEDSTPITITATISDWGDGGTTSGDAEMVD